MKAHYEFLDPSSGERHSRTFYDTAAATIEQQADTHAAASGSRVINWTYSPA
jgi:hypothetical protein